MLKQLIRHALEEFRSTDMSEGQLRKFGFVVGGIFGLIGAYVVWRGGMPYAFITLAAVLVLGGWLFPHALRIPYRLWMALAALLGFFVGNALLVALYYLVLTPLGLVRRAFGSDPLERRFDHVAPTYWKRHEARPGTHMERPF